MVPITREEKQLLKKKYPYLCVARTMRQDSKRKHYYCEERAGAMAYLEKLRQRGVVFDSRYPDGKPPVQEESRQWKQNGSYEKNGKRDNSGLDTRKNNRNGNGKSVGSRNGNGTTAEHYKASHPRGTDRFGGRN